MRCETPSYVDGGSGYGGPTTYYLGWVDDKGLVSHDHSGRLLRWAVGECAVVDDYFARLHYHGYRGSSSFLVIPTIGRWSWRNLGGLDGGRVHAILRGNYVAAAALDRCVVSIWAGGRSAVARRCLGWKYHGGILVRRNEGNRCRRLRGIGRGDGTWRSGSVDKGAGLACAVTKGNGKATGWTRLRSTWYRCAYRRVRGCVVVWISTPCRSGCMNYRVRGNC